VEHHERKGKRESVSKKNENNTKERLVAGRGTSKGETEFQHENKASK